MHNVCVRIWSVFLRMQTGMLEAWLYVHQQCTGRVYCPQVVAYQKPASAYFIISPSSGNLMLQKIEYWMHENRLVNTVASSNTVAFSSLWPGEPSLTSNPQEPWCPPRLFWHPSKPPWLAISQMLLPLHRVTQPMAEWACKWADLGSSGSSIWMVAKKNGPCSLVGAHPSLINSQRCP